MKNAPFIGLAALAGCSILFFVALSVFFFQDNASPKPPRVPRPETSTTIPSTPTTGTTQTHVADTKTYGANTTFIDYIPSDSGAVAVQITVPQTSRYSDGAPVVVYTPVFFTPERQFETEFDPQSMGFVFLSPLYPGVTDQATGIKSDGTFDYGGEQSVKAFRDVLKFASGELADMDGMKISERITMKVLTDNVGIFAFSHPGIMSTNVMAYYGKELPNMHYVVNRESPTVDTMFPLELGHFNTDGTANSNPAYIYSRDYSMNGISLDYSSIKWNNEAQVPYFDLNHDAKPGTGDFIMGTQVPTMFGKHYYSQGLTAALRDNGALTTTTWPADLATPEETVRDWPYRETVNNYTAFKGNSNIHFMLIFSEVEHVLAVNDAPQIHMAFDNLQANGIWTRLNPDVSYLAALKAPFATRYSEIAANTPVSNWSNAAAEGYDTSIPSGLMSLVGIAEMADRVHENNWSTNLSNTLVQYTGAPSTPPSTKPARPPRN